MAELVVRYKESTVLDSFKLDLKLYLHYVDDVCIVWKEGQKEQELAGKLNDDNLGLKIKIEQSSHVAFHFLDLWVSTENGEYVTNIYCKPTYSINTVMVL